MKPYAASAQIVCPLVKAKNGSARPEPSCRQPWRPGPRRPQQEASTTQPLRSCTYTDRQQGNGMVQAIRDAAQECRVPVPAPWGKVTVPLASASVAPHAHDDIDDSGGHWRRCTGITTWQPCGKVFHRCFPCSGRFTPRCVPSGRMLGPVPGHLFAARALTTRSRGRPGR